MKMKEHAKEAIYERWENGELVEIHYPKCREWQSLTEADVMRLIKQITRESNVKLNKIPFCTLFYEAINNELKAKNHG